DTQMAAADEPDLDDHLWTIAVARLLLGPAMTIQAPPNLQPGMLTPLVRAGVNDWGGVSPVTPDHVNPEAPWPHLDRLAAETAAAGRVWCERLAVAPRYVQKLERWVDKKFHREIFAACDASGLPRESHWHAGLSHALPPESDAWQKPLREKSFPGTAAVRALL